MSEQTATEAGQTTDGERSGELTVTRRTDHTLADIWKVLLTDQGSEALLGQGGRFGEKGHDWEAADGTHGVTRSYHPMEQIRFSWHADADAPGTLVDLRLAGADAGSELSIVHQHLAAGTDREQLAKRWADALERVDAAAQS